MVRQHAVKTLTPITLITGPLGSGKTTLLRYIVETTDQRIAILMNEFGEIAIDSRVVEGRNIRVAELAGGCVCCSLIGEFEAAVVEMIETVAPELIVVETTGVAEPDALIINLQDSLPQVRLDGVITMADADGMLQFPQLGHITRMQIEAADLILLNKIDLVSTLDLGRVAARLREANDAATILPVERGRIDPELLFGLGRAEAIGRHVRGPRRVVRVHQPEFESIAYETTKLLGRRAFEEFVETLDRGVHRGKGFVRFADGTYLFNFVAGRWELEEFRDEGNTALVFIGEHLRSRENEIVTALKTCER